MEITTNSAKLELGGNQTLTVEDAVRYVEGEIEKTIEMLGIEHATATVRLYTEGAGHDPVQKVDIKLNVKGRVINQSSYSRSIKRAIDKAIPDLRRQLRRYRTKRVDSGRNRARGHKHAKQADFAAEAEGGIC